MSIRKGALKPAVLELKVAASISVYLVPGRKSVVTSQFLGKPLPGRTNLERTQASGKGPEGCKGEEVGWFQEVGGEKEAEERELIPPGGGSPRPVYVAVTRAFGSTDPSVPVITEHLALISFFCNFFFP